MRVSIYMAYAGFITGDSKYMYHTYWMSPTHDQLNEICDLELYFYW